MLLGQMCYKLEAIETEQILLFRIKKSNYVKIHCKDDLESLKFRFIKNQNGFFEPIQKITENKDLPELSIV